MKKWASKKILLCPVCEKPYEYCHGQVNTPYFRHSDKCECEDKYHEPETEEHLNGKRDLYEWIKTQNGVTDVILEGWLPETKQRPDVMFKYDGSQYVIEYQCTPIATEYIERHDLYKAAGIIDIWICGTEKYLQKNMRDKFLEEKSNGYYDCIRQKFIFPFGCDVHQFLKEFRFDFGYENNHYKGTKKNEGVLLFDKKLQSLSFNGQIYDETLPNKQSVKNKRKARKEYYNWAKNVDKRNTAKKLDLLCKTLSSSSVQYRYNTKDPYYATLEYEIYFQNYSYTSRISFSQHEKSNIFYKLNGFKKENQKICKEFGKELTRIQSKYLKLFHNLRNQEILIIKESDKNSAKRNDLKFKRVKDSHFSYVWDFTGYDSNGYFLKRRTEYEFIKNLYEALKYIKIYNFDFSILIPNIEINGHSGTYDFENDNEIMLYFKRILGFKRVKIYTK